MTSAETNGPAGRAFSALDLTACTLLLDVDGTLIDIGPTPRDIHVPDDLPGILARLAAITRGALALVSGRPIADLDRMFVPLRLSVIGGHGAETRIGDGSIERPVAPLPEALRQRLVDVASGLLVEDKGYSLAIHYRATPDREAGLRQMIAEACAEYPGQDIEVLSGKAMVEIKRRGVDKGMAVRALMGREPFSGRTPVFIGDDVTDESVFAILPQLHGVGFSVARNYDGLAGIFNSPAQVRAALRRVADRTRPVK